MTQPKKIGLFGGSFDPVHIGHILVAQAAMEEIGLNRLYFIPAAQSPFKPGNEPSPAMERLRLLRLALAGRNYWEIDDLEIRRGGVSYSIDTVRDYARRHEGAELFFLIGVDHVALLPKWREAGELARLAQFVAIPRPGHETCAFDPPFRGRILKGFPVGVSASEIRSRVRQGLAVDHLVPPAVAEAIRNYRLYL